MLGLITRILVPAYRPERRPPTRVAIIVPLSDRSELSAEEVVSLEHLQHFLAGYPKYFVAPPGVSIQRAGYNTIHFPRKFFGSAAAHNQLLLWRGFYRAFESYEFVLIYHLDSLVLSDQIDRWCGAGFDYIGAPWVPCSDTPWVKEPRVGNGGFTLMKVARVLEVLHNRHRQEPATFWSDLLVRNQHRLFPLFRSLQFLQKYFPNSRWINRPLEDWTVMKNPGIHGRNNDFFWSFEATRYLPDFKIAPVTDGLEFAFEAAPRMCFEMNQRRLPFGCHAWTKFDRGFWEPHLLISERNGEAPAVPRTP